MRRGENDFPLRWPSRRDGLWLHPLVWPNDGCCCLFSHILVCQKTKQKRKGRLMSKKRSKVTIDLPDETIVELLVFAKKHQVSIRQLIREAFKDMTRRDLLTSLTTVSSNISTKVH
jgi:hypothetical protein